MLIKIFISVTLLAMPLMFLSVTNVNHTNEPFYPYIEPKKGQRKLYAIAIIGQILAIMFVLELWNLVDFF